MNTNIKLKRNNNRTPTKAKEITWSFFCKAGLFFRRTAWIMLSVIPEHRLSGSKKRDVFASRYALNKRTSPRLRKIRINGVT